MSDPRRRAVLELLPPGGAGAEIGVFEGDFAAAILQAARPRRLVLIDPWRASHDPDQAGALYAAESGRDMEAIHEGVRARFAAEIAAGRVEVVRGTVADAEGLIADGALDFASIDGDHREAGVAADLAFALRKVRPGGVIALDDYHLGGWWGDGVHRAAHAALGQHPGALEILGVPGGRLVLRRR